MSVEELAWAIKGENPKCPHCDASLESISFKISNGVLHALFHNGRPNMVGLVWLGRQIIKDDPIENADNDTFWCDYCKKPYDDPELKEFLIQIVKKHLEELPFWRT